MVEPKKGPESKNSCSAFDSSWSLKSISLWRPWSIAFSCSPQKLREGKNLGDYFVAMCSLKPHKQQYFALSTCFLFAVSKDPCQKSSQSEQELIYAFNEQNKVSINMMKRTIWSGSAFAAQYEFDSALSSAFSPELARKSYKYTGLTEGHRLHLRSIFCEMKIGEPHILQGANYAVSSLASNSCLCCPFRPVIVLPTDLITPWRTTTTLTTLATFQNSDVNCNLAVCATRNKKKTFRDTPHAHLDPQLALAILLQVAKLPAPPLHYKCRLTKREDSKHGDRYIRVLFLVRWQSAAGYLDILSQQHGEVHFWQFNWELLGHKETNDLMSKVSGTLCSQKTTRPLRVELVLFQSCHLVL